MLYVHIILAREEVAIHFLISTSAGVKQTLTPMDETTMRALILNWSDGYHRTVAITQHTSKLEQILLPDGCTLRRTVIGIPTFTPSFTWTTTAFTLVGNYTNREAPKAKT